MFVKHIISVIRIDFSKVRRASAPQRVIVQSMSEYNNRIYHNMVVKHRLHPCPSSEEGMENQTTTVFVSRRMREGTYARSPIENQRRRSVGHIRSQAVTV